MAITNKEQGVWNLDEVYNKQNEGNIWEYSTTQGLYMWGWAGDYGTLGQNGAYGPGTARTSSPVQIPGTTWNVLTLYNNFAHALKNDGSHWIWGSASSGVLGQNVPDNTHLSSPTQLPGTWSAITSSNYSMMGIKTDGTFWTWGENGLMGQLGQNDLAAKSSPVQVGTDTTWGTAGGNLSGSEYGVQAIKGDGTLWVWGYNRENLGLGSGNPARISSPTQVGANTNWSKCRGFFNSMIATKTDGTMWSWGYSAEGQGGHNDRTLLHSPKQVGTDTTWTGSIWKTYKASFAIKGDGTLWAWGNNEYGMLGINVAHDSHRSSPVQLPGTTWKAGCAFGYRGVGCTKTDGTVWMWGRNAGNLGLNSQTDFSSPTQLPGTSWDFTNQEQVYGGTMGGLQKIL